MPLANGEFVKVYLCLLRMYANPAGRASTLTEIADLLNHTESDVIRAIKYWERAGLLSVGYSGDIPVSITLLPISRNQDEAPAGSSSFARSEALSEYVYEYRSSPPGNSCPGIPVRFSHSGTAPYCR